MAKNILLCNGGGPTAVINLTNMGVFEGCLDYLVGDARIYAAMGGTGSLIGEHATHDGKRHVARLDDYLADSHRRQLVKNTPSTWIGSGRYKLGAKVPDEKSGGSQEGAVDYDIGRILEVCDQLGVGHVFFVGGDDTLTTLNALASYAERHPRAEWPTFLSVPKTIDNDLPYAVADPHPELPEEGVFKANDRIMAIDACPGFGTAATFVANKTAHLAVEAHALHRHYVLEIMGRDAGFLTAAALLAEPFGYGPHLIGLPEHGPFSVDDFGNFVAWREQHYGFGVYCVSEGIRDAEYGPLAAAGRDLFGNPRLGGSGELLRDQAAGYCGQRGLKADVRYIKFGELQRVSTTFRSRADSEIAYGVGRRAAYWALVRGQTGKLVTIVRQPGPQPSWQYGLVPTQLVSGKDKKRCMDADWVTEYDCAGLRIPFVGGTFLDWVRPLVDPVVPIAPAYDGPEVAL
ncbi:MAG: 6-phosphofructokinase [Armatimonadetes bacterium]|nr:6-phosphofructokinase [Armatimonadota bacterium]